MEPISQPPTAAPSEKPLGRVPYAIGGASFIPGIGILFGIIAVVWGIARRAWALVALGAGGILLTVVAYGALFYFGFLQRGGVYDKLRSQLAINQLNSAVKDIEFYKLQHGRYPASLGEAEPKEKMRMNNFMDPTSIQHGGTLNGRFYYQFDPSGAFYYLRSVGQDGVPFTSDDIVPTLTEDERKNTGLRLQP